MRGVRVLILIVGFLFLCGCGAIDEPRAAMWPTCDAAVRASYWHAALETCGPDTIDGVWPRGRRQHAWARLYIGDQEDEALAEARALFDSSERAEALFLAGSILANKEDPLGVEEGRHLMEEALRIFAEAANEQRFADTTNVLVQVALEQRRFDDALALAREAVRVAEDAADSVRHGNALVRLAATYNEIGRADGARAAFRKAEEILASSPANLALVHFKHAVFLLDLRTQDGATAALKFLDVATHNANQAVLAGQAERVADLADSIHFNRAAAMSTLERDDEALASLAELPATMHDHSRYQTIMGIAAARRGDTDLALAHFTRLLEDEVPDDYAVSVGVELARVYHAKSRLGDAERALRRATEHVESLRKRGSLELRPWILAHRARPYEALIELLVEQAREADALAVFESRHARALLDVTTAGAATAPSGPLTPAPSSPRSSAATAPLDRDALLERLGDREALVYLDLGSSAWRAHVAGGAVRVVRLPDTAVEAATVFRSKPDDRDAAAEAGTSLLPPELTAGDRPLTIVASGRFAELPFPALRRGARMLIDDRPIARLPGLAAMQCQRRAAGGPPVFIGDAAGDLRHAAAEVRDLAAAHHVPARIGAEATSAAVRSARDASWLHLSVHGKVDAEGGALVLGDGPFSAAAVLRERIAPAVVVLAGCSTAVGADAESWSSFPSAFLTAGSRFVIATARPVYDDAAARVMQAFYAQPATLDPIARLTAAQRVVAPHVPAATWASFAAWGVSDCDIDARAPRD